MHRHLCRFLFLSLISPTFAYKTEPNEDSYRAAVVEFCPHQGRDANDTMTRNALEYVRLIQKAAQQVDIIVFPEYGLSYEDETLFLEVPFGKNEPVPADNPKLHPLNHVVEFFLANVSPDILLASSRLDREWLVKENSTTLSKPETNKVIRMLSKAARDGEIYVSICLLEKDLSTGEELKYNTNVVFDRKGVVISKYRKFNLYYEEVNTTKVPDIAIFETDFGVRFGVFICADIFHKEPPLMLVYEKNITDFIYPNWFYSELKLGLSVQIQFGWAYMTDSNLLSSGINSLEQGSTGSGIFAGRSGPIVNIINERNETRLLTATVPKKQRGGKKKPSSGKPEGRVWEPLSPGVDSTHKIEPQDFHQYMRYSSVPQVTDQALTGPYQSRYKNYTIEKTFRITRVINPTLCDGPLCCHFYTNVTFTYMPAEYLNRSYIYDSYLKNDSFYHYQYKYVVFDGIKGFPDERSKGIQVCAIIPCLDSSSDSCWKKTYKAQPIRVRTQSHGELFLFSTTFNKIIIKSESKKKRDFTFPNLLDSSTSASVKSFGSAPDASRLDFSFDERSARLSYSSDRLMYAGLYSRIISRDGKKPTL